MIPLNSSKAASPFTVKNSQINKYSRQALSKRAYCCERNNASKGYCEKNRQLLLIIGLRGYWLHLQIRIRNLTYSSFVLLGAMRNDNWSF